MAASDYDMKEIKAKAEAGDSWAQSVLAHAYETGGRGLAVDHAQALYWYQLAATQGYAYAQDSLGYMFVRGSGIAQDFAQGLAWFLKAAEQGNASGAGNAGTMYLRGYGVPVDYAKARKWLLQGAEGGDAAAQCKMGEMAEKGLGVAASLPDAIRWYGIAAQQGNKFAIERLEAISPETLKALNVPVGEKWKREEAPLQGSDLDRETPPPRD